MATDRVEGASLVERLREGLAARTARARDAGDRHVSIAVPFRALERNRRFAASVLAGGIAYRLFSWLAPAVLLVGGVLGLGNAQSIEDSVAEGGLPQAVVDAIGAFVRDANGNTWWLLLISAPWLLWEGYKGAKALQLIHGLVWDEPAPRSTVVKSSLAFSGTAIAFVAAVSITWWLRDVSRAEQLLVWAGMIVPLTAIWVVASLHLPHGTASWKALLPGALVVAVGFQVTHGIIVAFLGPQLDESASLYSAFGVVATILFFMWVVGRVIVTAPLLNSSLHDELQRKGCAGHRPKRIRPPTAKISSDDVRFGRFGVTRVKRPTWLALPTAGA